jgi:glycosyltransferase involved in cell wall biosynthesis
MNAPELSVVIPTYNERDSLAPLMAELRAALAGVDWEVLFVDDSTDGTDRLIADIAVTDSRVRVLHRAVNRGGLAGAVVDGLHVARGQYICVLDADLQHPPARIPDLLATARENAADVVVASRYVPGGSASGLDGPLRQFYSRGLKVISQRVFPRRLAGVTDPLGGYFLIRRSVVQGAELRPIGYKILLEILVRGQWGSAREVPYRFQPRCHGASKADLRQGLRFLHHLARLLWDCSPSLAPLRLTSQVLSGRGAVAAATGA